MVRKIIFALIWLAFVIYAFWLFPQTGSPAETLDLVINLSVGKWSGINPMVIAIFCIMGILPWVYGAFILFDSPGQKISAYPFWLGSIGLGAFALLPYFVLRQPNSSWNGKKNLLLKVLDSHLMAITSTAAIAIFLVWGLANGSWSDFVNEWQTSQFINVMSLDFLILSLLSPAILGDDMKRRGVQPGWYFWLIVFLPLIGTLGYWCLRPQLEDSTIQSEITA